MIPEDRILVGKLVFNNRQRVYWRIVSGYGKFLYVKELDRRAIPYSIDKASILRDCDIVNEEKIVTYDRIR